MMMIIRALMSCFGGGGAKQPRCCHSCDGDGDGEKPSASPTAYVTVVGRKPVPGDMPPGIPKAIRKHYRKVVLGDVTIDQHGACVTTDTAVFGNVTVTAGGVCVMGNLLVVGDVYVDGFDGTAVNGTCINGAAIVLGNVTGRGEICVTRDAFVKGDIIFEGTVKANRTLCNWGARDIKPLPPPPAPPSGQPGAAGVEEEAL